MADTEGLSTALAQLMTEPAPLRGARCTVGVILTALDDGTATKLTELMEAESVTSTRIADVLTSNGHPVQAPSVARHRRRGASNGCRCPR
ncbi:MULTISPECIES: hypothetical protein [unclassified Streptomyces]|uniref:hypothetical protein n=1 Tax=unclassified Streptomyces TaxID=2593676 RepID=UPI0033207E5C